MADLKAGTTIGGTLVWTQGNFPLYPTGNTLLYKTFKVYSENDKPQATDNDFVSKASGGTYNGNVIFNKGINLISYAGTSSVAGGGIATGNGDSATLSTANIDITSWYGVGFYCTNTNTRTVVINTRTGDIQNTGSITVASNVLVGLTPTQPSHATRKDYVDGAVTSANSNANTRVLRAGDTMTGNLTAPNFISSNLATSSTQVPQLGQVVQRGVILDYGTY